MTLKPKILDSSQKRIECYKQRRAGGGGGVVVVPCYLANVQPVLENLTGIWKPCQLSEHDQKFYLILILTDGTNIDDGT